MIAPGHERAYKTEAPSFRLGRITDIGVSSPDGPTRAALGPTVCVSERPLRDELRKCERLLSALDALWWSASRARSPTALSVGHVESGERPA